MATDIFAISCLLFAFLYIIIVLIPECRGKEKVNFAPMPERKSTKSEEIYLIPDHAPVGIAISRLSSTSGSNQSEQINASKDSRLSESSEITFPNID